MVTLTVGWPCARIGIDTIARVTSGQAYEYLQTLPERKSWASVIQFLNRMVDEDIFTYEEEPGKGGYHGINFQRMDEKQFAEHVTKTKTDKLHEVLHR